MGSVNVNRNVSDVFYRYKMPRLQAKVEGKGNGIKTVIVNMAEVAKALGRPPTYPTKYFGCELGAQTQFDFKNERFIVNGSHDAAKLQDLLDGFIHKLVVLFFVFLLLTVINYTTIFSILNILYNKLFKIQRLHCLQTDFIYKKIPLIQGHSE